MEHKNKNYHKNIPHGSYTVKTLVTLEDCPVKLGVLKSIIDFTGLLPTYEIKLNNGSIRKYYDKEQCFTVCRDFLLEHPDTKSFFIKYKNSLRTVEEKSAAREKAKETMLKRYGYENPSKSAEIQEKKKVNFLKNHGESFADYMSKASKQAVDKRIATNLQRYGINYTKVFADKAKDTCLKRYGPKAYEEIYKKASKTILRTYGVDNPSKIPSAVEKMKDTKKKQKDTIINNVALLGGITFQEIYETLGLYTTAIYDQVKKSGIKILYFQNKPYILKEDYLKIKPELIRISELDGTSGISAKEANLYDFIKSVYSGPIVRNTRTIIPPLELDFYLPEKNLAIEFNGLYWHSDINKIKNYHIDKSKKCEALGIRLIHVYENEWDSVAGQEKIKSIIGIALSSNNITKLYARNCDIKRLTNSDVRDFINNNHLQGHRNAQVTYGLFYKECLVQVLSLSKSSYNCYTRKYKAWEIIRSCTLLNTVIVGGLSKLYKAFITDYAPEAVFSYCDFNKFNGVSYEKLGMSFIGYTEPDFKWLVRNGKYGYTLVNRNPTKNNEMKALAVGKVWGAGNKKYLINYR